MRSDYWAAVVGTFSFDLWALGVLAMLGFKGINKIYKCKLNFIPRIPGERVLVPNALISRH